MIEAYKTNRLMRETYLRINDIIYAEIWDTYEGYHVALCSADNIGFPESPELYTIGQCHKWVSEFCPELSIKE